ncbi:hypothetical protein ACNPQM_21640 [Streptomyces sp. NPDC056231]|uniref:hypothetical protein n=1 Tax=Streptomyces sp. NPDC056231 TaxID=3345755 RepID=UPI003AB07BAF
MVLAECGTHVVFAAAIGARTVAETQLADSVLPSLEVKGVLDEIKVHQRGSNVDEIDELVLKTYPVIFGAGMPMFSGEAYAMKDFALEESRSFKNGVIVRRYLRNR